MRYAMLILAACVLHAADPRPPAKAQPARSPDSQIEAAIRARLAKSKINADHFTVHVQGGVATLEGRTDVIQHKGVATRLAKSGGAALFIDYGYAAPAAGDSLQALRRHAPHPVLEDPGEADLTAHVDFAAFTAAAEAQGVRCHGPVPQGLFLRRLGILERTHTLLQQISDPRSRNAVTQALERLIDERQMGTLFKVLALGPASVAPLPGLVQ